MIKPGTGRKTVAGAVLTLVLLGLAATVATMGGVAAWEYTNSDAFCANTCHQVHPEEPVAHSASAHARVKCVECHMGRLSTLELMLIKPTHVNELWGMVVGYERPRHATTMPPARDSCEACHRPDARHDDTVRTKARYADDASSTETRTTLVMQTGGIHRHIAQEITYVATDPARQRIPWVQARAADGMVTTWHDPTSGITPQQIEKLERRRMDCVDCHNASGHPFGNPANLVDEAIRAERISRAIPSVKARALAVIAQAQSLTGTKAERAAAIDKALEADRPKQAKPELEKAERAYKEEMRRILLQTTFSHKDLGWKTFPDNLGHNDFPGCFRCHDGKHLDGSGQAIRVQCTLCHALPKVVSESGARSVASTVSPDLTAPPTHQEPSFMQEHRAKVDDTCQLCHGKVRFGTEGGNFCSNPACHGRKWPEMNLDVQAQAAAAPTAVTPQGGKK